MSLFVCLVQNQVFLLFRYEKVCSGVSGHSELFWGTGCLDRLGLLVFVLVLCGQLIMINFCVISCKLRAMDHHNIQDKYIHYCLLLPQPSKVYRYFHVLV